MREGGGEGSSVDVKPRRVERRDCFYTLLMTLK